MKIISELKRYNVTADDVDAVCEKITENLFGQKCSIFCPIFFRQLKGVIMADRETLYYCPKCKKTLKFLRIFCKDKFFLYGKK